MEGNYKRHVMDREVSLLSLNYTKIINKFRTLMDQILPFHAHISKLLLLLLLSLLLLLKDTLHSMNTTQKE
jgi:hypothetical protein